MPWARSTSEMSTVTPQTITITRQGICLNASPSSPDRVRTMIDGAEERGHADVDLEDEHADRISAAMTAIVIQCRRSNRVRSRSGVSAADACRLAAEQLQAAEQGVAAEGDDRMREQVVDVGLPLEARAGRCAPSGR